MDLGLGRWITWRRESGPVSYDGSGVFMRGVNIREVQRLFGHSSLDTTIVCLHVNRLQRGKDG